jgi:phage baseplate assembly protein V
MNLAEILRKINNLARFRTVTETKSVDGKALARVKTSEESASDFLPVMNFSNSFKRHWIPVRVGEQVLVISPFGEADSGFIIRAIFNKGRKEPAGANDTTEIIEYEDGTRISYDTEAKELKVQAAGKVTIICTAATITATSVNISASASISMSAPSVSIDGPLHVTSDISTDASVSDSKGSLTDHVHTGVTPGGSNTGDRP